MAPDACIRYLDRLPLSAAEHDEVLKLVASETTGAAFGPREKFIALQRALVGGAVATGNPVRASIRRRLGLAAVQDAPLVLDAHGRERLSTAPPLVRSSMVPRPWSDRLLARALGTRGGQPAGISGARGETLAPDPQGHWHAVGTFRRVVLLGLIVSAAIAPRFRAPPRRTLRSTPAHVLRS